MKNKCRKIGIFFTLLGAFIGFDSTDAFAQGEEEIHISTEKESSFWRTMGERATLSFFGVYRGAALQDPGNIYQPLPNGNLDTTSPQSLEGLILAGYKFRTNWLIGAYTHFYYFPMGLSQGAGQDFQMRDPSLVVSRENLYSRGGLNMKAYFTITPALTPTDILGVQHLAAAFTPVVNIDYKVPGSRLNVGVVSYLRGYVPTPSADQNSRMYYFYLAPNASYNLGRNIALTLWVDLLQTERKYGTHFLTGMHNFPVDVQPGFSWSFNKYFTINPILNIYPSKMTWLATSFQANLIARAF